MKSALIRYLIAALILAVLIAGLLLFIGGDKFMIVQPATEATALPTGAYKFSYQILAAAAIAAILGTVILWSVITFIWDMPSRIKTGVSRRKRGQALESMEEAMLAAVSGDADRARKKAARARALIGRPALGQMISAQAAELSGDAEQARAQYTAMLGDDRTQKFGLRGLATLAHKGGDLDATIDHAKSAYENNKSAKWAFDILFSAQVEKGDWAEALKTLELAEQRKHIGKDKAARRRAVINTARAQSLEAKGQSGEARELAASVVSGDSGFAPGAALAARLYVKAGEPERAAKSLERAWKSNPHPALALAYSDVYADEPEKKRARRMKSLRKQNANHRESILLLVQEEIGGGDGQAAWQALSPLLSGENISGRLCELAAKTEALRGNADEAALWTARAAGAPIEADWSDLDPQGTAFNYNDTDWARMVVSYGDDGVLIHPRRERFEAARPALGAPLLNAESEDVHPHSEAISEPSIDLEDVKPPNPDF